MQARADRTPGEHDQENRMPSEPLSIGIDIRILLHDEN
jgi:hypothetical protein